MKYALIIGNNRYQDPKLAQLKAPQADARALARILKDQSIGAFEEVVLLVNKSEFQVSRAISTFLTNKKPDDLVLVYFSGHGILDDRGRLFLALKDTQTSLLKATAISSSFIADEMDSCRSKRQILILDCCHSGAFGRGIKAGAEKAITETTFEGNGFGRVVLTASDSTQYALEGNQVIAQTELSLFTHFLLEGLQSGRADGNEDGYVSLDEWYDYTYTQVLSTTPKQIPHKWSYNQQGNIIIAQNPLAKKTGKSLPDPFLATLNQKVQDYQRHKIILDPRELEMIAVNLEKIKLGLDDAHKQLFLLSAVAHGNARQWLELSGVKGPEWLRQAYQDEEALQEVRVGAVACLGQMGDILTYDHLVAIARQGNQLTKRSDWLNLLAYYLDRSLEVHRLPWLLSPAVFPRLARLRIKEGEAERARMSRVAAYLAPICGLVTFAPILFMSNPGPNLTTIILSGVVNLSIGIILSILFAQVLTSLAFITVGWRFLWQALILAGVGSAFGIILFLILAGYIHIWFAGGIIGVSLAILKPERNKKLSIGVAIASSIFVFICTLAVLNGRPSVQNAMVYAFSASLFTGVYLFSAHLRKPRSLLY